MVVLDEGDVAYRASRGNFGLVWVQSKGMGLPRYGVWTMTSATGWSRLAAALLDETGVDVHLEQRGGLHALLSEAEVEARVKFMQTLLAQPGMSQYEWKLLDRAEVADLVPGIGPDVRGATRTPVDGIANPLKLLRALHTSFAQRVVDYLPRRPAQRVRQRDGVFEIDTPAGTVRAHKIVLASGLSNKELGAQVGLDVPVRPQRGQIVVLERTRRMLETPLSTLRQTDEGTWLIGDCSPGRGRLRTAVGLPILGTFSRPRRAHPARAARGAGGAQLGGAARDVQGRLSHLSAIRNVPGGLRRHLS